MEVADKVLAQVPVMMRSAAAEDHQKPKSMKSVTGAPLLFSVRSRFSYADGKQLTY